MDNIQRSEKPAVRPTEGAKASFIPSAKKAGGGSFNPRAQVVDSDKTSAGRARARVESSKGNNDSRPMEIEGIGTKTVTNEGILSFMDKVQHAGANQDMGVIVFSQQIAGRNKTSFQAVAETLLAL